MEILSAGAFINLENQGKIERLKFTAVELAKAALGTTGFTNTEKSGRSLALEFWQGLEYMCRESEEAAIKNIFLNHFLDRLREFRPTQTAKNIDSPRVPAQSNSVPIENEAKTEDEFLGVIERDAGEDTSIEDSQSAARENLTQTEEISTLETSLVQEAEVKTTEDVSVETVEEAASFVHETEEQVESAKDVPVEAKTAVGNLSLPEKEPYQFGKCTVTATIQLLPEGCDGTISRKAVLSVRTHDFAPQISMVELAGNNLLAELIPELEKVLARYQRDLPAKVMDKLKKEKTATKKPAPKTTSEAKTVSQEVSKPKESVKSETAPSKAIQADAPAVPPAALETGQQGSLFGF